MRVTLPIDFVGRSRAVVWIAAAAFILAGAARPAGASDFSGGPIDDPPMSSMGVVKVIVASKFTPAMAGYPGFFAPNKLYSPVLIDNGTVIGRSAPHNNGISGSVPVGNLGTLVSYPDYASTPPDFVNPLAPTREVFTEIRKMRLVTSGSGSCSNHFQDPRLPTVPAGIPVVMAGPDGGAAPPALPRSLGQVQSKTPGGVPANDFPARSFFDVFVEVNLPPFGPFPGVQLRNSQPMVVTNQGLTAFPPAVIYIHGATTASPLVFKSAGTLNGIPYAAGEVFGWLVLAGHGTQIDCSDTLAVQNFINTVLGPPNDEKPGLPLPGPNIVYVSDPPVAGFSGPGAGFTDQGYITILQNAGYNVIRYNPPDSQNTLLTAAELSALNTNDLVIIGRALASAAFQAPQVAQWNNAITKPILCLNGYLSRSSRMGWTTGGPTQPDDTPTPLTAANPTDPKVDFLLSDVDMLGLTTVLPYDETIDRNTSQLSDPPVAGGTVLLTASYVQEAGGTATSPIASDLPAGTPVRGGAETVAGYRLYFSTGSRESATAPNGIPQYTGRENLTPTGEKVFLRAVQLALNGGTVPQTDPATPMSISRPPASITVIQGSSATFSVRALGAAPRTLQWQRDGVDIPGANTPFQMSSITISNVSLADNGAQFRVVASNPNGSVFSATAVLTVTPDDGAPRVLSAGSLDSANIGVCFDELLDQGSAEDQFNYDLSDANGASIMSAKLQPDGRTVVLTVAPPLSANFTLTVNNAKDRFGNEFSAPVVVNGVNLGLTGVDVGTLSPGGTNSSCGANSFQVSGGGLDVAGTADAMHLVYKTVSGDFDVRARVTAITGTPDHLETTAKALLLARESAANNAANVNVYATPRAPGDNSIASQVRATTGGTAAAFGATFVGNTLPNGWLRIRRSGNSFTTSSSLNAVDWSDLGTTTLTVGSAMTVGAGVVSHRNGKLVTATFDRFRFINPPIIITQPANQTVAPGGSATFTVVASGEPDGGPLIYQWRFNGTNIVGATNSSYAIASAQASDLGSYDVSVRNTGGAVTSQPVTLSFRPAPVIASFQPHEGGEGTILTVNGSGFHGGSPDDYCLVLVAPGNRFIDVEVLTATPTQLVARVGVIPPAYQGQPLQLMLGVGEGARAVICPAFHDVDVAPDNWIWRGDAGDSVTAQGVFFAVVPTQAAQAAAAPPLVNFHSGAPAGNMLTVTLNKDWGIGARYCISARVHAQGTGADTRIGPATFTVSGNRFQCAARICDLLVKAFAAHPERPLTIICSVLTNGTDAVIKITLPGGQAIDGGNIDIIQKAPPPVIAGLWDIQNAGLWRKEIRKHEIARWYRHYEWVTRDTIWFERRAEGLWITRDALESFTCRSHCIYRFSDGRVWLIWRTFSRVDVVRFWVHYRFWWPGRLNPLLSANDTQANRTMMSMDDVQIVLPMTPLDPNPSTPVNEAVMIVDENGVQHFQGEPGFEIPPDIAGNPNGFGLATTSESTAQLPPAADRIRDVPMQLMPGMANLQPGVIIQWLVDKNGNVLVDHDGDGWPDPITSPYVLGGQKHQGLIAPPTGNAGNALSVDQGNNQLQLFCWELGTNGEVRGASPGQVVIGPPVDLNGDGVADGPIGGPVPADPTVREAVMTPDGIQEGRDPTAKPVDLAVVEEAPPTDAQLAAMNANLAAQIPGFAPLQRPFVLCISKIWVRRIWSIDRRFVFDTWLHHWVWQHRNHIVLTHKACRVWLTKVSVSQFAFAQHCYPFGLPPTWRMLSLTDVRFLRVCFRVVVRGPNQVVVKIDQMHVTVPSDAANPNSPLMLLSTRGDENALFQEVPAAVLAGLQPDPLPVGPDGVFIEPIDPVAGTLDIGVGGTGVFDNRPLEARGMLPAVLGGNADAANAPNNNQLQLYCWALNPNGTLAQETFTVGGPQAAGAQASVVTLATTPAPAMPSFEDDQGNRMDNPTMFITTLTGADNQLKLQQLSNGGLQISWDGPGQLQAADQLVDGGPGTAWADVANGALSPVNVSPTQVKRFYRLRR